MGRLVSILALALVVAICLPAGAQADFGIGDFDVTFTGADGSPATQAGSHPFAFTTSVDLNVSGDEPDGRLKDLFLEWPPGLVANTIAYPRCKLSDFEQLDEGVNDCPDVTAVGVATSFYDESGKSDTAPVFNLVAAPGSLMSLGFRVADATNVVLDVGLNQAQPYRLRATVRDDLPASIELFGASLQFWGVPADPAHDGSRGRCAVGAGECPANVEERPLLTLPTSCEGPLESAYEALSWEDDIVAGSSFTHDGVGDPQGMTGCSALGFSPLFDAAPTTEGAKSSTGLDISIDFTDEGLTNPGGLAQSTIREAVFVLPEGMAAGPVLTSGTGACTEADFAEEALGPEPGEGCPDTSKVGTVEVDSSLIEGTLLEGTVYRAVPFANPLEDAPMALYVVIEDPDLGLLLRQPVGIEPDPETGQLVVFAEELPQLPFSDLHLHLEDTAGGALISPPLCGAYETLAELVPWSDDSVYLATSAFEIVSGPDEGPCPTGGGESQPERGTDGARVSSPSSAPGNAPAPSGQVHRRHRCPKGKHRVRRHGKLRCVRRHHRKAVRASYP